MIHTSDNLFHSNSSPILELSVKFASQICHENINKPLDAAYLADFGILIFFILKAGICPDAYFNSTTTKTGYQFNLLMSGRKEGQWNLDLDNPFWEDVSDASYDTLSVNAQRLIHACNWNNQFAFPWEIGMYWDFKVGKPGRRAIGK